MAKPLGERLLERPRRWEDNIKMDLREAYCEIWRLMELTCYRIQRRAVLNLRVLISQGPALTRSFA